MDGPAPSDLHLSTPGKVPTPAETLHVHKCLFAGISEQEGMFM